MTWRQRNLQTRNHLALRDPPKWNRFNEELLSRKIHTPVIILSADVSDPLAVQALELELEQSK